MRQQAVMVLVCFLLLSYSGSGLPVAAGREVSQSRQEPTEPQLGQRQEKDRVDIEMEKKMEKARLQDRYRILKRDSERLLELATELKQYVDKSDERVLSMDVIKKCDEIEKLARSVRTKMKGD